MNPTALCLPVAALVGLAAAWLGMAWLRLVDVALPATRPASAWAVPCVLAGAALGAVLAARRGREPLAAARRALALTAVAALVAVAREPGGAPGPASVASAVLPAALAAAGVAAVLVRLAEARRRATRPPTDALGGILAAAAVGVAVAAARSVDVLTGGIRPEVAASIALLLASALCGPPLASQRHVVAEAEPAPEPLDAAAARRRKPPPRTPWVSPCLAGFVLALALPALVTLQDQVHGAAWLTRTELLAGVACGGALAGMLPGALARRGVGVRGFSMIGLALALMASHWLPGVVLDTLSGMQAALVLGLPLGLLATGLIVVGARAGRINPLTRAGPLALAASGATLGAAWPLVRGGVDAGAALRGAALLCAVLSVPASLAARPPGPFFAAWVRRWTASGLGVATVYVLTLGTAAEPAWRGMPDDRRLLAIAEDPRGVISLVETAGGGVRVGLDNRSLLAGAPGALLARRMARLAAALAPDADEALVLGLGNGQLAAELAALLPGPVTCAERVGRLVELAAQVPWTTGPDAPRPRLEHAETLRALGDRRGACALIVASPEEPGRPGAGARLSVEHHRVLREALAPGGVAVQWLPLYAMPWPAFASAAQAFLEVFPDARLFVVSLLADLPLVALVGGLGGGLPGVEAMDAVLARRPSPAGLGGAPDVHDLFLADGWTLLTRLRDAEPATLARPWPEFLSMRRFDDADVLARINLRLLADLAVPLDTASLRVRPAEELADRRLGMEFVARSSAARALLAARATALELRAARGGATSADEQRVLEDALHGLLVQAWRVAPGHLDARQSLLERALALTREDRWGRAAEFLDVSIGILPDGVLLGLQCGVLLELGRVDDAVHAGREAVALAPGDRTALLNLGSALLFAHEDDEARAALGRARAAFLPQPLPPLQVAALGLLEGEADSPALARALVDRLPPTEPWVDQLLRLLERAVPAGG